MEGVTPERTANSLYLMFRWRQRFWNLSTTASLIPMPLTSRTWYLLLRWRVYAFAYIPDRCYTVLGVIRCNGSRTSTALWCPMPPPGRCCAFGTFWRDDALSDETCFAKIEAIVSLLEELGVDCGSRHDFG